MALTEATGIVEKTAFIAGRGIKATYLVVQTSILGLARGVLRSLETIYDGTVGIINFLPGVELKAQKGIAYPKTGFF